jgi:putative membrane protein
MGEGDTTDPRVFFAAERTYLAWIRTGLALMGFGFVVARFGIFLQELVLNNGDQSLHSSGLSVVLGVLLLIIGVIVCVASTWRHVVIIQTLRKGEVIAVKPSGLAIGLALALAAVGIVMAFYLLHTRNAGRLPNHKAETTQTQNPGIAVVSSDVAVK